MPPHVPHVYRIEKLTQGEYATLCWLAERGYDAGILKAAGVERESTADGSVTLGGIAEPEAWAIRDRIDGDTHAFLTSNGSPGLERKLLAFTESIV